MKTNVLNFGDNPEILHNPEYFPDECIDLHLFQPAVGENQKQGNIKGSVTL
jgi:hypothetical protein